MSEMPVKKFESNTYSPILKTKSLKKHLANFKLTNNLTASGVTFMQSINYFSLSSVFFVISFLLKIPSNTKTVLYEKKLLRCRESNTEVLLLKSVHICHGQQAIDNYAKLYRVMQFFYLKKTYFFTLKSFFVFFFVNFLFNQK